MNLLWQQKLCNLQQLKIAVFTYRSPHFCFPWRRPCDYHAMLHGSKDNLMLAKPLAARTYLSSIVSELYDASQCENRHFYVPQPTFLFPLDVPAIFTQYVARMERQCNACQTRRSMYLYDGAIKKFCNSL